MVVVPTFGWGAGHLLSAIWSWWHRQQLVLVCGYNGFTHLGNKHGDNVVGHSESKYQIIVEITSGKKLQRHSLPRLADKPERQSLSIEVLGSVYPLSPETWVARFSGMLWSPPANLASVLELECPRPQICCEWYVSANGASPTPFIVPLSGLLLTKDGLGSLLLTYLNCNHRFAALSFSGTSIS